MTFDKCLIYGTLMDTEGADGFLFFGTRMDAEGADGFFVFWDADER
jgi:hypothetical protein